MRSQPGKQIIAIHILCNISRSKGNHTMEFGQSSETFILKNHPQNGAQTFFPDHFLKAEN